MENESNSAAKIEELQQENSLLQEKYSLLQQQNTEIATKLNWFEEQYRLSKQRQFGSSSEQTSVDQVSLFDEAEVEAKPDAPEPTVEEITYTRRKKQGQREESFKEIGR